MNRISILWQILSTLFPKYWNFHTSQCLFPFFFLPTECQLTKCPNKPININQKLECRMLSILFKWCSRSIFNQVDFDTAHKMQILIEKHFQLFRLPISTTMIFSQSKSPHFDWVRCTIQWLKIIKNNNIGRNICHILRTVNWETGRFCCSSKPE